MKITDSNKTNENQQWSGNFIGTKGAMIIFESIKSNSSLTSLNLESYDKMIKK